MSRRFVRAGPFLALIPALLVVSCATTSGGPGQAGPPAPEPGGALGRLTCSFDDYAVELLKGNDVFTIEDVRSHEVPPGQYMLLGCVLRAKEDGRSWSLMGAGSPSGAAFDVAAGQETAMTFGPPLESRLLLRKTGARSYDLSVKIVGRAGEVYSPARIKRDGQAAPAPGFEVRDARGEIVAQGRFAYG